MLASFLDVKGAFDNVNINILLQQLSDIGCSTQFIKFIKFITFERFVFTEESNEIFRMVYKGVHQGGVISPLLYDINVKDICKNIPKSVNVSQFADDTSLYCKTSNLESCKNILEKAISVTQKIYIIWV